MQTDQFEVMWLELGNIWLVSRVELTTMYSTQWLSEALCVSLNFGMMAASWVSWAYCVVVVQAGGLWISSVVITACLFVSCNIITHFC